MLFDFYLGNNNAKWTNWVLFFPFFIIMFLSFPFVILSANRKRRNTGIKWYLFTSINRTKNRKSLISQTFPLSKFPLSNSRRNIFFPIQAYLTNKEKFFFSLSLPFISTQLFEEKINWISGQMNLNIPFLRYTLLAFDEMKIKRICKIRFVRDFSYLF